ncbi:FadR/GntR family transcriptional regulator [Pelomonas cellulosilytica]|uniref:FadR family transcriptional regulator n=1 Tax=Pelomonas cellulosilytica TaxID=2906762 RepID=A0ABS8Y3K3_9BURK|nr:FadR/GntR family transcriptional regulator [Pelomonas sp. P8]MCE4557817.1 FadR family transcriptional regulator [Pelomonas sp. P8]
MAIQHRSGESRRQYQLVADRICALIEQEKIGVGARLPAERELALQLGVSRPSLREALIALEIDGRVEIRGGSGVYVCARQGGSQGAATSSLGDSPAELMQARVALEGAVITLAAARVTKAGLQRVEEAMLAMREEHNGGGGPVDADRRFHLSIAEMAGNAVLTDLVGKLFDGRHSPIAARMSGQVESSHTWHAALDEHEAIYRALESRNPQGAAAAMCTHLLASLERWVGEPAEPEIRPPLAE